jgi:hypothetical protein
MRSSLSARGWALLAAAGALAFVAACSLLLKTSGDQCTSDADCSARGGGFAGTTCVQSVCVPQDAGAPDSPFACLGNYPSPPTPPTIDFAIVLTDFFTTAPVQTVTVTACPNASDPACMNPIATRVPDATGTVKFTLDTSKGPFKGYVIIESMGLEGGVYDPDSGADADINKLYFPSRVYYANPAPAADTTDTRELVSYGSAGVLQTVFGRKLDPTLGVILASTVDCSDNTTAGVSVSLDMSGSTTLAFYFQGGVPSLTATQSDSFGIAGWINVPVGGRTVSARLASTQQPIGDVSMYVLGGWLSYADVGPNHTP